MITGTHFGTSIFLLLQGALLTLEIAVVAMIAGLMGGAVVGILNCDKIRNRSLSIVLGGYVALIRGTPLFVQLLVIYYALPELIGISFSPFVAGVVTLGLNSTAYISEIVRGAMNAVPEGQWEASHVLGLTQQQALRGIIAPQMVQIALPSLLNELTALIKETSILMMIGVAELTKVSKDIVARELDPMTIYLLAAFLYLLMTTGVAWLGQFLQKRGCL